MGKAVCHNCMVNQLVKNKKLALAASAVQIFEISNRIEQLLQYSIRFETSTIIQNFRMLTVTDLVLI